MNFEWVGLVNNFKKRYNINNIFEVFVLSEHDVLKDKSRFHIIYVIDIKTNMMSSKIQLFDTDLNEYVYSEEIKMPIVSLGASCILYILDLPFFLIRNSFGYYGFFSNPFNSLILRPFDRMRIYRSIDKSITFVKRVVNY